MVVEAELVLWYIERVGRGRRRVPIGCVEVAQCDCCIQLQPIETQRPIIRLIVLSRLAAAVNHRSNFLLKFDFFLARAEARLCPA